MRNILITGGAGFIGSNFIHYLLKKHTKINVINVDALTYAGNLENLDDVRDDSRYIFSKADITDKGTLTKIYNNYDIDTVVNFAAESHVDNSILNPSLFSKTNFIGTQTLLEVSKQYWNTDKNPKCTEYRDDVRYLQVSTDEVYGALGPRGKFTETTPLSPNSPYSASKASADLMVRAYHNTFKLPINITRCSNNYGPFQFPEKLIPLMFSKAMKNQKLPVYGDGLQVRDWLYVEDHCTAIDTVLNKGENGETYNIGGNNEKTNISIVNLILQYLDKPSNLIEYIDDRLGHDRRYAIDNTKITTQLNWKPQYTFENGIMHTLDWYLQNQSWIEHVNNGSYKEYYNQHYLCLDKRKRNYSAGNKTIKSAGRSD